jgi:enamine deaminase RidA (YjgF/YER057c/UK114 family)
MKASTPHSLLNPTSLPKPVGYAHVVVPSEGKTVILGGQAGLNTDGSLAGPGLVEQFDRACHNVEEALLSGGARPEHLVSVTIVTTSVAEYRGELQALGEIWQKRFGKHYPAVTLFEVNALFEPGAKVELMCTAVIPR